MNNKRRKEIVKVVDILSEVSQTLTILADEETEAYENLPESLQNSERGEEMSDWCEKLISAQETIDEVIDELSV